MKLKTKLLLILTLVLAASLRLWQIDRYPAGFNADEAAYGYNAYSLIQTGKDEFGIPWPVHLKSFADYKPAGTAYLMIPFVKAFGLDQTVVRLPSILAGIISVFLIFFLVRELFSDTSLSLLAALFLAISPWHIHFSRGAWETNLATTFLLMGILLFFKGLKNSKFYVLSVLSLAVSVYTYHAPRLVIPLMGLFLVFFYREKIFGNLKVVAVALLVGLAVMIPFLLNLFGPAVSARFSGIGVFSETGPIWQINRLRGEHDNLSSYEAKILHNKPVAYSFKIIQNWFSHFDGTFLFINGDPIKRSNSPDMGEMYLFDLVFVPAGIFFLIRRRPQNWQFVFLWLAVAPAAASLTFQVPSALRAHNMLIPLMIISAYGAYNLIGVIRKSFPRPLFMGLIALVILFISWNTAYFLHQYFVHYPKTYPEAWEYGIKDLVDYLGPIKNDYQKVYVTEQYDQPYIVFLFYLKYPPEKFQKEAVLTARDKFGFSTVRDFDNFHFENITWDKVSSLRNVLVCGTSKEIPKNANIVKTINFLNGQPAFLCAKT